MSQPREIIFGAADEVLSELKRDDIPEKKKKVEVEGLLGEMDEEKYALLVGLGKKITDYGVDKRQAAAAEGTENSAVFDFLVIIYVMYDWQGMYVCMFVS